MNYKWSYPPFVPTPPEIIRRMLSTAKVGREDTVYDLGCGDGRILMSAVKEFGVKRAVGFEIKKDVYKEALSRIKGENLLGRISLHNLDFFDADISEATVITLYLTGTANEELKPKLERECRAGTRIVSRVFNIDGWKSLFTDRTGDIIHLYHVPYSYNH
ncbi:MAG: SAM-dependent methyltransferase [Candidatus Bathyarchaeia archaeon]